MTFLEFLYSRFHPFPLSHAFLFLLFIFESTRCPLPSILPAAAPSMLFGQHMRSCVDRARQIRIDRRRQKRHYRWSIGRWIINCNYLTTVNTSITVERSAISSYLLGDWMTYHLIELDGLLHLMMAPRCTSRAPSCKIVDSSGIFLLRRFPRWVLFADIIDSSTWEGHNCSCLRASLEEKVKCVRLGLLWWGILLNTIILLMKALSLMDEGSLALIGSSCALT